MKGLNILDWTFEYIQTAKVKDFRISPLYTAYFIYGMLTKNYDFAVNEVYLHNFREKICLLFE